MERLSTTPFGARPVSAVLMKTVQRVQRSADLPHADKWTLFRDLCTARQAFGVTDRDLTVLNALLSFHKETTLSDNQMTVVFPSNAALSERAHGMAESTLRRHLAALVGAGLILRHDSPNGKRYAHKDASGSVVRAFGFDLRPLLVRAGEIAVAASEARAAAEAMKRQRERLTLLLRDARKLLEYGLAQSNDPSAFGNVCERCAALCRLVRRKLDAHALSAAVRDAEGLRSAVLALIERLEVDKSKEVNGNDRPDERHYQNSNTDSSESECLEKNEEKSARRAAADQWSPSEPRGWAEHKLRDIPFRLVRSACPEMGTYARGRLEEWRDLVHAAHHVRGMMGVSASAWDDAVQEMGEVSASVTLACMLERVTEIRRPGGYLRSLTRKAGAGEFSPIPMVMALLNDRR